VGLGNPGKRYEGTRHNVGFETVDELARRWSIDLKREKFHAWFGDGLIRDQRVVCLKPTTFMNRSGDAVLSAGKFYQLELSDLLVILDDFALPLGMLRVRMQGSSGGQKGLQNIIDRIGSNVFARLRLGIGETGGMATSHVLSPFSGSERGVVSEMIGIAADAVECWVVEGTQSAMNKFNVRGESDS
jgi:PTH1 family peptidyl-tRNA hydrolase